MICKSQGKPLPSPCGPKCLWYSEKILANLRSMVKANRFNPDSFDEKYNLLKYSRICVGSCPGNLMSRLCFLRHHALHDNGWILKNYFPNITHSRQLIGYQIHPSPSGYLSLDRRYILIY